MFGWLTGKGKKESAQGSVRDEAQNIIQSADFTPEIKKAIDIYLANNAKPSLLYAKAAGYSGEVIDYSDISTFLDCLRVNHHSLKGAAVDAAKSWIENELDFSIKSDYWEHFFFSPTEYNGGKDGYREIEALRAALRGKSIKSLWSNSDQNVGDYALSKAVEYKRSDLDKIFSKLEERKDALKPLLSRALSSGKNKYGETDFAKYFQEINDFFDYFFPEGELQFYYTVKPLMETANYLDKWFEAGFVDTAVLPDDGIDFEHWCAAKLEEQGWKTIVSQASGDQGVDIEARWGDFIVAVQCKRYTQPVGNKAVQEVYTGAKNINANAAAVIGTGGYTKSALAVAKTTSVELFDAAEIGSFSERFGFEAEVTSTGIVDQQVTLEFSSLPQRMMALMFRTVLRQFDVTDLNVSQNFKGSFFDCVDERGVGVMSFKPIELASLLIFSNFVFPASFRLTSENIEALRKHDYPMLELLEVQRFNEEIHIFELIGEEVLDDVRAVFVDYTKLLPLPIDLDEHFLFRE